MGGGKSRALCEEALRLMIEHEGIEIVLCRQAHTSIVRSTKKTMMQQVLPQQLIAHKKESGGEDWVRLKNGSICHFVGLDDPIRWFSSELGFAGFDEAQEIAEDDVVLIMGRLRQRCPDCIRSAEGECQHYPHSAALAFNPDVPSHWLHKWFIDGANQTPLGRQRDYLFIDEEEVENQRSIGDTEFIFARATDNPYLSERYIKMLTGMRYEMRQRLLEGKWVYLSGKSFFDNEALAWYEERLKTPVTIGQTHCCRKGKRCRQHRKGEVGTQPTLLPQRGGPWSVWKPPVRERFGENGKKLPAHRYVVAVDVSSGSSKDYSAIQVVSVEDFEQVAEFQAKIEAAKLALEVARIGHIYNQAVVAVEITGGWGYGVQQELRRLKYPRLYMRPDENRLAKKFTDRLGWETTTKTRAEMLDVLEKALREKEFVLNGVRTHEELAVFVLQESINKRSGPKSWTVAAQSGANDDLTIALAIAVTLASKMPRKQWRLKKKEHVPHISEATGY